MIAILIALVLLVLALPTVAQSAVPVLPAGDELGSGWFMLSDKGPVGLHEYFRDVAYYAGPDGSRIEIFVSVPPASEIDHAWGETAARLEPTDITVLTFEERSPPNTPSIDGCVDVRRIRGKDPTFFVFPEAITACRTTEMIMTVRVSGHWQNLPADEAADALVQKLLELWSTVDSPLDQGQVPGDLHVLFPTALEISDGSPAQGPWHHFEVVEEGTQTRADVAAWLGDSHTASLLNAWGWESNAFRAYRMEAPGGPTDVTISIHQFTEGPPIELPNGSVLSGPLVALDAFSTRWASLRGVTAEYGGIVGPGISRQAGSRKIGTGNESTLFVASFDSVIRVTATGPGGPKWDGIEFVVDKVLERIEGARFAAEG